MTRRRRIVHGPTMLGIECALHAVLLGDYDIVHVQGFENGFVLPIPNESFS